MTFLPAKQVSAFPLSRCKQGISILSVTGLNQRRTRGLEVLFNCQHFSETQWKSPRQSQQAGIPFLGVRKRGRSEAGLVNIPGIVVKSRESGGSASHALHNSLGSSSQCSHLENPRELGCQTIKGSLWAEGLTTPCKFTS